MIETQLPAPRFKRLVFCFDGTWNATETKLDTRHSNIDDAAITNVLRLARGILANGDGDIDQIVYYTNGVGTGNILDRWLGGLTGYGLSDHILGAYTFLGHNFDEGDEIWCFGFSRGAYAARSFAGLVGQLGVLPPEHHHLLPKYYAMYRQLPTDEAIDNQQLMNLLNAPDHELWRRPGNVRLRMLGVWDTVGALGVPTPMLQTISKRWVGFHDTYLGGHIDHAFQALALDEERRAFRPDLWTAPRTDLGDYRWQHEPGDGQVVEQVWFAGAHSNIGGGYRTRGLADIALAWMLDKARSLGLSLKTDREIGVLENPCGELIDSFTVGYKLLEPFMPRLQRQVLELNAIDSIPLNVGVHESVFARMDALTHYDPAGLKVFRNFYPVPQTKVLEVDYHDLVHQPRAQASDTSDIEHRSNTRNRSKPPQLVTLRGNGRQGLAWIINSSEEGLRLRQRDPLPMVKGMHCTLETEVVSRECEVIWQHGRGVGLHIVH